jgi:uncharacterized protein YcfJ
MPRFKASLALLTPVLLLTACAQTPMGPTVAVMPGPNKPYDVFQADQAMCRQTAEADVAGQAQDANMRGVGAAALTTALGAGLGAVIGGGRGAAIGAASGAVGGTGIGAMTSDRSNQTIQQRYDIAFSQCMYARGNQVPGYAPPAPAMGQTPSSSRLR